MSEWMKSGLYVNDWTMRATPMDSVALVQNGASPARQSHVVDVASVFRERRNFQLMPNPSDGEEFALRFASPEGAAVKTLTFYRDPYRHCGAALGPGDNASVILAVSPERLAENCATLDISGGGARDGVIFGESPSEPILIMNAKIVGEVRRDIVDYRNSTVSFPASLKRAHVRPVDLENLNDGTAWPEDAIVFAKALSQTDRERMAAQKEPTAPPSPSSGRRGRGFEL